MKWPNSVGDIVPMDLLAPGYRWKQLGAEDVPKLVAGLKNWYPDIHVGLESRHLDPEFYLHSFALAGDSSQRDFYGALPIKGDEITGLLTFEKNNAQRTVTCPMGVIAPEHRGSRMVYCGQAMLETTGRALGAEMVFFLATLKIPHQQAVAEKLGYRLVGIVPAHDRDMITPGVVKRVFEAYYAKVLITDDDLFLPPAGALTEKTKELWDHLFAGTPWSLRTSKEGEK